jgi:hypothetical protein
LKYRKPMIRKHMAFFFRHHHQVQPLKSSLPISIPEEFR